MPFSILKSCVKSWELSMHFRCRWKILATICIGGRTPGSVKLWHNSSSCSQGLELDIRIRPVYAKSVDWRYIWSVITSLWLAYIIKGVSARKSWVWMPGIVKSRSWEVRLWSEEFSLHSSNLFIVWDKWILKLTSV